MTTISSRSKTLSRHDKGTPAGGRFAATAHAEADVQLSVPAVKRPSNSAEARAERWQEAYEQLAAHKRLYGKLPRPGVGVSTQERSLYRWLNTQRRRSSEGALDPGRASVLDSGIEGWRESNASKSLGARVVLPEHGEIHDRHDELFQQRMEEVMAYKLKHRRLPVFNPAKPETNRMAEWLGRQRNQLKAGELSPERKQALDALYPEWTDVRAARWAQTAAEVADFKDVHGKLPGDSKLTDRERALQVWVKRQKIKEAEGKLSADQIQALNVIDGDWRADRIRISWENNLTAAMLEYQEKGAVPDFEGDSGRWLLGQRSRLSKGDLDDDQLSALDKGVPGWRIVRKDVLRNNNWHETAGTVRAQIAKAGRLPSLKDKDPEIASMGSWIRRQRVRLKDGVITGDQIAELDETIPGWRG